MKLTSGSVFLIAMAAGTVFVVSNAWLTGPNRIQKTIRKIDNSEIYVTDQLQESDFTRLYQFPISTIVDMRPDGESRDQLSSDKVAEISKSFGIIFDYIPIPHDEIPAAGVDKLSSILENGKRPILLYCRTGRRALRTFCLADASRKNGHTSHELKSIADNAGFDIKDIQPEIARRIASRRSK